MFFLYIYECISRTKHLLAKPVNKLASTNVAVLVSETLWSWLWRHLPVLLWKTSSMRCSRRLSLFCPFFCTKNALLAMASVMKLKPLLCSPSWCIMLQHTTGFSAYWCVTTINLCYFPRSGCSHLSPPICKATEFCTKMCVCVIVQLVMSVSPQLLCLALHCWTGTRIKELCTVMTRIDFQFPVEWLYHCLWLRQFSLYYSAS